MVSVLGLPRQGGRPGDANAELERIDRIAMAGADLRHGVEPAGAGPWHRAGPGAHRAARSRPMGSIVCKCMGPCTDMQTYIAWFISQHT